MKIKRMTATFGCLEHRTLTPGDGLNIVELPNEGGKSTWAGFLRVMLYGLSTRDRDKKGHIADKNRYAPWQGGAMEGEILCTWKGRDILLRRFTQGSTPLGGFSAVYADSGQPVEELTGDNVGQQLTGVSQAVFQRSAFLGQTDHRIDAAPELERRIAALVSSGEETVSAQEVKKTLQTWKNKLKSSKKRGSIPELDEEMEALLARLEEHRDLNSRILQDESRITQLAAQQEQLERELENHKAISRDMQAQAYARAKEELDRAVAQEEKVRGQMPKNGRLPSREDLEAARDEVAYLRTLEASLKLSEKQRPQLESALEQAQAAVYDPVFRGESGEAACRRARTESERAIALQAQVASAGRRGWISLAMGVLCGALVFYVFHNNIGPVSGMIGGGAVAIFGGVLGLIIARRARGKAQKEYEEILVRYEVDRPTEIPAMAEDYRSRRERLEKAREELERLQEEETKLKAEHYEISRRIQLIVQIFAPEVSNVMGFSAAITRGLTLYEAMKDAARERESAQKLFDTVAARGAGEKQKDFTAPTASREQVEHRLKEVERELSALRGDLAMAQGRRGGAGDPAVIQSRLEELKEKKNAAQLEYDALVIAETVLTEADVEMRSRFSPELNRCAGEYLNALTAGRYRKVTLDRELDARAQTENSVTDRDVLALSRGTADQLWLAVRLAVCRLALPEEEPCPLVLDDALVNFDDGRTRLALELLSELSRERQILLFTCHSREKELAGDLPGVTCLQG